MTLRPINEELNALIHLMVKFENSMKAQVEGINEQVNRCILADEKEKKEVEDGTGSSI